MPGRLGRGGYSFFEMLTVIVVLGIMLAITVLSIAPSIRNARVRNALNVVSGDLHEAQALAIKHGRPIAIVVQASTKQYQIRDRDSSSIVHRQRSLGPGTDFSLDQFSASPSSVEIFPNGVARATTTFTLGLEGYVREVILTRAGQIQIVPN